MANRQVPDKNDVAALLTFLTDESERTVSLAKNHLKQILRQYPAYRNLLENPEDPAVASHAKVFLERNAAGVPERRLSRTGGAGERLRFRTRDRSLGALRLPRTG